MKTRRRLIAMLGTTAAAAGSLSAHASELSYTYVDFQAFSNKTELTGLQVPVPGQTVTVDTADGDGISIGGQVSLGQRFYLGGRFQTSIVDVGAVVVNPFVVAQAEDNFDLVQSRLAFGYYRELAENFDLMFEVGLDSTELDFGSFAGENFDMKDDGAGARVGFRWNPRIPLEIYGYAHHSAVAIPDIETGEFEADTNVGLGMMWYFFGDLGVGVDYSSGEFEQVSFSMRFSFGDLALRR
jgi:hypothetical protein